jgi:DNA polymerase elongation subunit (family B)
MYGFLGAPKLNYNYPNGADAVTRYGRETLQKGIKIITGKEYEPEEESNENEDL